MDELAQIISRILKQLSYACIVGSTGLIVDNLCETILKAEGVTSYNKGYHPGWAEVEFPANLCVSPNGVIMHGIPNGYEFKSGDMITLDLGIQKNGLCADAAITVPVGTLSEIDERLMKVAKQAVYEYISLLKPGANTEKLAKHMRGWVEARGFKMNRRGAGHQIGTEMHMKPNLYNTPEKVHTYATLTEGMVVCIEPIVTRSMDQTGVFLSDGWSLVTMDRKPAAMFEHMVRITKDGPQILTTHF